MCIAFQDAFKDQELNENTKAEDIVSFERRVLNMFSAKSPLLFSEAKGAEQPVREGETYVFDYTKTGFECMCIAFQDAFKDQELNENTKAEDIVVIQ
jgi:hypothetical protein